MKLDSVWMMTRNSSVGETVQVKAEAVCFKNSNLFGDKIHQLIMKGR